MVACSSVHIFTNFFFSATHSSVVIHVLNGANIISLTSSSPFMESALTDRNRKRYRFFTPSVHTRRYQKNTTYPPINKCLSVANQHTQRHNDFLTADATSCSCRRCPSPAGYGAADGMQHPTPNLCAPSYAAAAGPLPLAAAAQTDPARGGDVAPSHERNQARRTCDRLVC